MNKSPNTTPLPPASLPPEHRRMAIVIGVTALVTTVIVSGGIYAWQMMYAPQAPVVTIVSPTPTETPRPSPSPTTNALLPQQYTDSVLGYSVRYPADWQVITRKQGTQNFTVFEPINRVTPPPGLKGDIGRLNPSFSVVSPAYDDLPGEVEIQGATATNITISGKQAQDSGWLAAAFDGTAFRQINIQSTPALSLIMGTPEQHPSQSATVKLLEQMLATFEFTANSTTYTTQDGRYTFQYPADWKFSGRELSPPAGGTLDPLSNRIEIWTFETGGFDIFGYDEEKITTESRVINGVTWQFAVREGILFQSDDKRGHRYVIASPAGDSADPLIHVWYENAHEAEVKAVLNQILTSWKFN
jgi:hypothetical protein